MPTIEFVKALALEAGEMMMAVSDRSPDCKSSKNDLVTATDKNVEIFLKQKIASSFPSHLFFCEESVGANDSLTDAKTWVIDPVDGTTNFVHGFPGFCVSIAYVQDKKSILGCVYAPMTKELFWAEKGHGAYLNGKRIYTAPCESLINALVSCGTGSVFAQKASDVSLPVQEQRNSKIVADTLGKLYLALRDQCRDVRRIGSSAIELSYVACGRLSAYIEYGPKEWDVAAGSLIVEEAGGVSCDWEKQLSLEWKNHRALATCDQTTAEGIQKLLKEIDVSKIFEI